MDLTTCFDGFDHFFTVGGAVQRQAGPALFHPPNIPISRQKLLISRQISQAILGLLTGHLQAFLLYRFPETFSATLTMLLDTCTRDPPRIPGTTWGIVTSAPLQRLPEGRLGAALRELGGRFQNHRSEAEAKGWTLYERKEMMNNFSGRGFEPSAWGGMPSALKNTDIFRR
jgi:hypothetical protein